MTKVYDIKDLFRILVTMNVNVINHMTQEYLQYENYKCKKEVVDELVEECNENIDENEMIYNVTLNDYRNVQILYNIHSIICDCFVSNHRH